MSEFVALNGQTVTDAQLDAWESSYAQGKFPAGEKNLSAIIHGAPRALSSEGSETLSVKIPAAMKRALTATADKENMTTSELVRAILTKSLIDA